MDEQALARRIQEQAAARQGAAHAPVQPRMQQRPPLSQQTASSHQQRTAPFRAPVVVKQELPPPRPYSLPPPPRASAPVQEEEQDDGAGVLTPNSRRLHLLAQAQGSHFDRHVGSLLVHLVRHVGSHREQVAYQLLSLLSSLTLLFG